MRRVAHRAGAVGGGLLRGCRASAWSGPSTMHRSNWARGLNWPATREQHDKARSSAGYCPEPIAMPHRTEKSTASRMPAQALEYRRFAQLRALVRSQDGPPRQAW